MKLKKGSGPRSQHGPRSGATSPLVSFQLDQAGDGRHERCSRKPAILEKKSP
jgi:hypothetical protein